MNRETFERQYGEDWERFEDLLDGLEKEGASIRGSQGSRTRGAKDFPILYRRVCHHLALVRHRLYGTDLERRLNVLALRGHNVFYRRPGPGWERLADFVATILPRQVRSEARLFWLCFVLLFGPMAATTAAVVRWPELIYGVVDAEGVADFEEMYDPDRPDERTAGDDVMMFGYYIYNNVGIAFRTFAGGIFFGVGSIAVLIFNGVVLGGVTGHITVVGFGETFYPFVAGHSSFELLAIVLAGMAGLKLGLALAAPGRRLRGDALRQAGREAVTLIYGAALLLVLAAFVEAFWSSTRWIAPSVKYAFGALGWLVMAAYFALAGRGGEHREHLEEEA